MPQGRHRSRKWQLEQSVLSVVTEGASVASRMMRTGSTREGTETCFKVAPQNDEQSPAQFDAKAYAPKPEDYQLGNFTLAPLPPRMVAGESTICYKVTYAKEKVSEMSACYTPDGIAMYLEMTGPESSIHFEAQRLERRVNDADLVPPPAQSMEDLYKGISN